MNTTTTETTKETAEEKFFAEVFEAHREFEAAQKAAERQVAEAKAKFAETVMNKLNEAHYGGECIDGILCVSLPEEKP
jgi:hypothetical protein